MNLSQEEFASLLSRNPGLQKKNPAVTAAILGSGIQSGQEKPKPSPAPKYHNHKVFVYEDGFVSNDGKLKSHGLVKDKFDSEKEYARYQELLLLVKAGKISDLTRQAKFVIQEAFVYRNEHISEIAYVADFVYKNSAGEQVVEDVKGVNEKGKPVTATKDFKLKWKLLKAKFPQYLFQTV